MKHGKPGMRTRAAIAALGALALPAGLLAASSQAQGTSSADLRIVKSDSADPVAPGATFSYTLEVTNAGPDLASNVVVVDRLPQRLTFVSASSTQGTCTTQGERKVTCLLNDLGTGAAYDEPVTVTIQVRAPDKEAKKITNTATVSSDTPDPRANNDSDTETTAIVAPETGGGATCSGRAATIVGTGGSDVLRGTAGSDVIRAKGGADEIKGLDGEDFVCAGAGRDQVRGGGENDLVKGAGGRDRLTGQGGADTLKGGGRRDRLVGGNGDDTLNGGGGNDRCRGGAGDDAERSC